MLTRMSAQPAEAATPAADPDLAAATWELDPLVDGRGEAGVDALLDEAGARAAAFAERHAGRVAELDGAGLAAAMAELAALTELVGRAGSYAALRFSADTSDPAHGALLQRVQERGTAIETQLVFFELEWAALPDERADELLGADGLDFCRHHLRTARRYRPHLLSEPEEKLMAEKAQSGRGAWSRLFAELVSAIAVELPGAAGGGDGDGRGGGGGDGVASAAESVPLDVALSRLIAPDREVRRATAEAVTAALEPGLRTRAFIFNTLLLDKSVDDRLRHFPSWIASRNLANEASDESVAALVQAVRGRYEVARRWYRLKAAILGVDRLADYDRSASIVADTEVVPWARARALVLESFGSFSPELAATAERFFTERWIDAPLRPGKRGGAFSAPTVPSVHPYVLVNYTAQRSDVLTLAHELGHGVHQLLGARQGVFHHTTPLTLAETASVFGETLTLERLLADTEDPGARLALLAESVERAIATVFRQVAMNRFEDLAHTARREQGELSVERIGDLWAESQVELLGDAVELTDGYRTWWSYVPHFINTPGYVYAYAYGMLLALSVYQRAQEVGPAFEPRYVELLAAGGSRSPEELGAIVGVDLADPGFWDAGLALVEARLTAAEDAARAAGHAVPA